MGFFNKAKASASYYGLSLAGGDQVKYEGAVNYIGGPGDLIPEIITGLRQQMPSLHIVLLPTSGLLIIVRADGSHLGQKFSTPMGVKAAADFIASALKEGKKVKEISNLGAFEINF